jgi:hypothetical protein
MKTPSPIQLDPSAVHAKLPWLNRVLLRCDRDMDRMLTQDFNDVMNFLDEHDIPEEPFRVGKITLLPEESMGVILRGVHTWWAPRRRINTVTGWLERNKKHDLLAQFKEQTPRLMADVPDCDASPRCPPAAPCDGRFPGEPVGDLLRNLVCWVAPLPRCYQSRIEGADFTFYDVLTGLEAHIRKHFKP